MRLFGKVAVVTGAAAGLGRAIAARYATEGASVIAADINEADGQQFAAGLKEQGCDASFVPTDVSDEGAVRNLFHTVADRYAKIDVLCNNAAVLLYDRDAIAHELSLDTAGSHRTGKPARRLSLHKVCSASDAESRIRFYCVYGLSHRPLLLRAQTDGQ